MHPILGAVLKFHKDDDDTPPPSPGGAGNECWRARLHVIGVGLISQYKSVFGYMCGYLCIVLEFIFRRLSDKVISVVISVSLD
jgi:hypothetical protein